MLWRDKGKKTFIQYSVRYEECRVTEILTPLMWEGETVVQCSSKIQDPKTTGVRLVQYKIKGSCWSPLAPSGGDGGGAAWHGDRVSTRGFNRERGGGPRARKKLGVQPPLQEERRPARATLTLSVRQSGRARPKSTLAMWRRRNTPPSLERGCSRGEWWTLQRQ